MFKLQPDATFKATVLIPNGDTPLALKVIYRRKDKDALGKWVDSAAGRDDADLLGEVVAGWEDVDADFTPENFASLLANYPGAGMALFRGYLKSYQEAERKN